jgi:hypothetical protein
MEKILQNEHERYLALSQKIHYERMMCSRDIHIILEEKMVLLSYRLMVAEMNMNDLKKNGLVNDHLNWFIEIFRNAIDKMLCDLETDIKNQSDNTIVKEGAL